MVTLIIKMTVVMINMIAKIRITITITEKNNNNGNNTATKVTIKTQNYPSAPCIVKIFQI